MSSTFAGLGVSSPVAEALRKRGIETPFAVQTMVVPDVCHGRFRTPCSITTFATS